MVNCKTLIFVALVRFSTSRQVSWIPCRQRARHDIFHQPRTPSPYHVRSDRAITLKEHQLEYDTIFDQLAVGSNEMEYVEEEISEFYRRDPRDDPNRPIPDKDGLRQLLSQRFATRKSGDYDKVREIDALLWRNHGVRAFDNPCFWTREVTPPVSYLRRRARRKASNRWARYGPTGHPYMQAGDKIDPMICPLAKSEIHAMLSRRYQCVLESRIVEAEAMGFELLINGVITCDSSKQWRADGRRDFDEPEKGVQRKPEAAPIYEEDVMSNFTRQNGTSEAISLQRVQQLVQVRSAAIVRGETDLADLLSYELYKTYEVGVNDQSCTWSLGSKFDVNTSWEPPTLPSISVSPGSVKGVFPPRLFVEEDKKYASPAYRRSEHSRNISNYLALRRIETLVQERIHLREERKFIEADAIRRELWETYYVGVNDRLRQWSVAGVLQDDDGACVKVGFSESCESQGLTEPKRREVESLLGYLESTRSTGNDSTADRIVKRLRDTYAVVVDAKRMEWSVQPQGISQEDTVSYQLQGPLQGISPRQRDSIQALIDRRHKELRSGNQQVAVTISEALWRKHQVVIDDDMLTWQIA
jgi:hypothetical protein